jgi:hypothetical protein
MTGRFGRRGVVLGGVAGMAGMAGAVGACTAQDAQPPRDTPAPPVSPDGVASSGGGPSASGWRQLARSVRGSLARPGSASYDTVRLTQNPRYDGARPLAVLSAAGPRDVATALAFARDHGLPVAIRAGGHSYPGWSAGNGRLVIDLRRLHRVTLTGTSATIGAGASLVHVYDALGTRARGIAGGSCPTVGIGGLTQGGGVGVLTRVHGLTCDAVTAMRVVLADGRIVTASADHEPDLFWALRGGGGGHLGVVTSFTMSTFAAPTITRAFLAWPFSAAPDVVPHWLATDSRHTGSYLETMLAYAGCSTIPVSACHTGTGGALQRVPFAATSHIIRSEHVDLSVLLARVHAAQGSGLKEAGISMDALGGAVDDVGPRETAFGHRGALATVQYTATYTSGPATPALSYVRTFRDAMTPSWGDGAYVNYADASLAGYQHAYFGRNAARLADARASYDPQRVFTQPQDY